MSAPTAAPPAVPVNLHRISAKRRFKDRTMRVLVVMAFLLALIPLTWVLWTTVSRGIGLVLTAEWWTTSMRNVGPNDVGGGALAAIQGTLIQAAIATAIAESAAAGQFLVTHPIVEIAGICRVCRTAGR